MDIEQFKKLSTSKIEAGNKLENIRKELKKYKEAKQDAYEGISQSLEPLIDVQKDVKQSIDEKQDKLITQLQENQKAITSGLEGIINFNQLAIEEPEMDDIALLEAPKIDSIDLDKGFDEKEVELLIKYELPSPTDLYKGIKNKEDDFKFYDNKVSKLINDLRLPKANPIRFIKSAKKIQG